MLHHTVVIGLAFCLALGPGLAWAQGSGVPRPAPVEAAPLAGPGAPPQAAPPRQPESGSGGVTLTQESPAPSAKPPSQGQGATPAPPSTGGRPTLVPTPGDPLDVVEVTLPAKPAAVLAGTTTWDEGFDSLKEAFATIEGELAKAGIKPAGRPVTVFTETDDMGFSYQAMIPVTAAAAARPNLTPEIGFGRTPEGKAYLFLHRGPYENIDSTYETITAYLDAKGLVVKDVFVEEYLSDLTDRADDSLEINIFVQPQ
jgi:effector-binding domain-containing protein